MAVSHHISVPTEPGWQTVVLYSYNGRILAEFVDPKGGRSRWQDVTPPKDPIETGSLAVVQPGGAK